METSLNHANNKAAACKQTEQCPAPSFQITVVPLTLPELMSQASVSTILEAAQLFLQTDKHPYAAFVLEREIAYRSMDDLYESAPDFTALNSEIAARLIQAGDCVYATTGDIAATQLPAILEAASANGGSVRVLPGIPAVHAAFPDQSIDAAFAAPLLPERLNPERSMAVSEISDQILAGEVKLRLSEYYPDDWEIQLSAIEPSGGYVRRAIHLYELDRQTRYDATTAIYVPAASFDARTRYGYWDLYDVLARLRAPGGCPWDREQTHESLKTPLMEECYELMDAIDSGDDANICEELGDVLMQVAFHTLLASEQGCFQVRDVSTEVVQKLIYRHPHVFGNVRADTSAQVLANWDQLKMTEKHQKTQTEVLKSVPRCFPALTRAAKVQKKAAKVGFDWPDALSAFPKIHEETEELARAMRGDGNLSEEMGDLLFAVVNVARLMELDPEALLREATDKFIQRFADMESLAATESNSLEDLPFYKLDALWEKVKKSRKL